jgi:basic membrane protein A
MVVSKRAGVLVVTMAVVAAFVSVAWGTAQGASSKTSLVVGGIYIGSAKDAGFNQAQHDGVMYLKNHVPGVKVLEAENVPETPNVESVMQNMINQGAKLIFATSFGYQDFALKVAAKNPTVDFEHAGGNKHAKNFGTYWAWSSPVNYALGVAAAKVTKTGKLGFVGAIPIPDIVGAADAFHLGAQSVNPKIKTVVIFTGSFSDPAKEASAVNTLANQHVDVVAQEVDSPITVAKTAEQRHIFVSGYHSAAAQKYAPKYWLTGVDFHWGAMMVQLAKDVLNGTWKARNWVAPVSMGIARLAPFGPQVPAAAKAAATKTLRGFVTGQLKSPFKGPVYDQSGKLRVRKGEQPPIGGKLEYSINWLAKGMIGRTK